MLLCLDCSCMPGLDSGLLVLSRWAVYLVSRRGRDAVFSSLQRGVAWVSASPAARWTEFVSPLLSQWPCVLFAPFGDCDRFFSEHGHTSFCFNP